MPGQRDAAARFSPSGLSIPSSGTGLCGRVPALHGELQDGHDRTLAHGWNGRLLPDNRFSGSDQTIQPQARIIIGIRDPVDCLESACFQIERNSVRRINLKSAIRRGDSFTTPVDFPICRRYFDRFRAVCILIYDPEPQRPAPLQFLGRIHSVADGLRLLGGAGQGLEAAAAAHPKFRL